MASLDDHFHQPYLIDWFSDQDVNEVLLDARHLWFVRSSGRERRGSPFARAGDLRRLAQSVAKASNVRLDPMIGAAGGSLDDGAFRWHCLLPPMAREGPLVSIRRHRFASLNLGDFRLPQGVEGEIVSAMTRGVHLIVAGPTGSGKSSLLSALLKLLPEDERVFLIESIPELGAASPGLIRLSPREANLEQLGAFGLKRLLRESLRLLPDRMVVGEVRGTEVPVLLDAMRAGHRGILTTMHAAGVDDVLRRITSRLPSAEKDWHRHLSAPLLLIFMARGHPPSVRSVKWIGRETLAGG